MRKIEVLKNTSVKGVPVGPGDTLTVDDADARTLISYQLAKPYEEPKKEVEEPVIEEKPVPKTKRKGGKRK